MTLWDLADPERPRQIPTPLPGSAGQLTSAAFSGDGHTLVAGSAGRDYHGQGIPPPGENGLGTVILWDVTDLNNPHPLAAPLTGHEGKIRAVAFSPDGRTLAYGGAADKIYLWDLSDPTAPHPIGLPLTGPTDDITTITFSPDGRTLAAGNHDGATNLWDVSDLSRPVTPVGTPLPDTTGKVVSLDFLPDNSALAVLGPHLSIWDLHSLATNQQQAFATSCAATGGGLDPAEWAARIPGLSYQTTCADTDHDPAAPLTTTDVRRFGQSAIAHPNIDVATATPLLLHSYQDTTTVTTDVTINGDTAQAHLVQQPAHPTKIVKGDVVDTVTGAVYQPPQMIIRDPNFDPHPTTPSSPSAYTSSDFREGVQFYDFGFGENPRNVTIGLRFAAGAPAVDAERTVDVFSVATLGPITGTTDVATLYHYSGSWTFGVDASGKVTLKNTQIPQDSNVAEQVLRVS